MLLIITTSIFASFLICLYLFLTYKSNYWKRRNIVHPKPNLLVGNYRDVLLMTNSLGKVSKKICEEFPNEHFIGTIYGTEPVLLIKDPELVKTIMTKDFYYFNGREISDHVEKEFFTTNVFFESGDYWKVTRQNLTPLFSSAKLKQMFYLIVEYNKSLEKLINKELQSKREIDIHKVMSRYTVDCVGSCVFGIETNMMSEQIINNPFSQIISEIEGTVAIDLLKRNIRSIWPTLFYSLGYRLLPKNIDTFFNKMMSGIFKQRNYKPTNRHDLVDSILTFKSNNEIIGDSIISMKTGESKKTSLRVDDRLLAAQCGVFFIAGNETSSLTITFTLYELAKRQDLQRKVQKEIDEYLFKRDGKLEYDCITDQPYLEACVDEAMRLYPVLPVIAREVMEPYTLPTGLRLEKGVRVHIPVLYLHYNPSYFQKPKEYRPERFMGEEKKKIVPYTFMPFGEGPRTCIGMRFAKMVMMSCLTTILKSYTVEHSPSTKSKLEMNPKAFTIKSKDPIFLILTPRKL